MRSNILSAEEIETLRREIELVEHLDNGFYLYPGVQFDASVVAQGPFDYRKVGEVEAALDMIGGKMGVMLDFSIKMDPPTGRQRESLIPSRARSLRGGGGDGPPPGSSA